MIRDEIENYFYFCQNFPNMNTRFAKSYSIVDHQLLHGGYLSRMTHEAMVLYLFLVVVGDKEGRSFYADKTIMGLLRLSASQLDSARKQLLSENLIGYHRPYFWVKNIQGGENHVKRSKVKKEHTEAFSLRQIMDVQKLINQNRRYL